MKNGEELARNLGIDTLVFPITNPWKYQHFKCAVMQKRGDKVRRYSVTIYELFVYSLRTAKVGYRFAVNYGTQVKGKVRYVCRCGCASVRNVNNQCSPSLPFLYNLYFFFPLISLTINIRFIHIEHNQSLFVFYQKMQK